MNFITHTNFFNFLDKLRSQYEVYVPTKKGNHRFYKKYTALADDIVVGEVRAFEPLKAFFTRAKEKVAEDFKDTIPHQEDKPFAVVGAKACDLKGFQVQDHVFGQPGDEDPFYKKTREQNLIISADCTLVLETCYCLALGVSPFPQECFDINLSSGPEGFLVETGSLKGEELVKANGSLFETADSNLISQKEIKRKKIAEQVENNIRENAVPGQDQFENIIEKNYKSPLWEEEAKTCVECGACNTVCPTCHCFLLSDQKNDKHLMRYRSWDSCMLKEQYRMRCLSFF